MSTTRFVAKMITDVNNTLSVVDIGIAISVLHALNHLYFHNICVVMTGYDAKACPIARGKFDSKNHSFGQVHSLI